MESLTQSELETLKEEEDILLYHRSFVRTCGQLFAIVFIKYNIIQLIYANLLTIKMYNAIM